MIYVLIYLFASALVAEFVPVDRLRTLSAGQRLGSPAVYWRTNTRARRSCGSRRRVREPP